MNNLVYRWSSGAARTRALLGAAFELRMPLGGGESRIALIKGKNTIKLEKEVALPGSNAGARAEQREVGRAEAHTASSIHFK